MKNIFFATVLLLASTSNVFAQETDLKIGINQTISSYYNVKDALAKGDAKKANQLAKVLNVKVHALDEAKLTKADLVFKNKMDYDSKHISEVVDIAHQREHFNSLSTNLYYLIKDLHLNDRTVFRMICSINKQYFLSDKPVGADPYFAATHFTTVSEKIQPANK
ncbi:Protein of unknown function [Mucilaginibacter pineti]|uniref:DUF3347 domain-containing protein n=1 Tax=Mucilaginibacter pineti TaxID=1391627 RepID=A0A1G7NR96_9SPHI|nr:DUF3347 domain-containing protein [Mucilaginibacter pineti]SDF76506.1 Protein of unknown function [Mucilaginibacter pineti]